MKIVKNKKLRILLLSTYDERGGASIACLRMAQSLSEYQDVDVKILVAEKSGSSSLVTSSGGEKMLSRLSRFLAFTGEPLAFTFLAQPSRKFSCSHAQAGDKSIIEHPWVKEADLIHMHWINHGFLSLDTIAALQKLGKPVVWTLHDMWAFTGICHYCGDCEGYLKSCGNCPVLKRPHAGDLSARTWMQKQAVYTNLNFITTSGWLGNMAAESGLLREMPISVIPSSVDTLLFKPACNKQDSKKQMGLDPEKIHLLFGAEFLSHERKGLPYLLKALTALKSRLPGFADKIELVLFGKKFNARLLNGISHTYLGEMKNQADVVRVYDACDTFIIPSLEDNLPNMVMEALACGLPVVAFNTGGIPEMIKHQQNGYLADCRSSDDLLNGILWLFSDMERYRWVSSAARTSVIERFSHQVVSQRQMEYYQNVLRRHALRHSAFYLKPRHVAQEPDGQRAARLSGLSDSYRVQRRLRRKSK